MPAPADVYGYMAAGLNGPAEFWAAVTPANGTDLSYLTRALWIGVGGNVAITGKNGSSATFANVPSGTLLPVRAYRVLSTGTTATNIVAIW
jgi:hypothetical protein